MSWHVAIPLAVAALPAGVLVGAIIGMLMLRVLDAAQWVRR